MKKTGIVRFQFLMSFPPCWGVKFNYFKQLNGGEGGIRTHVSATNRQPDFESGALRPLRYLSVGTAIPGRSGNNICTILPRALQVVLRWFFLRAGVAGRRVRFVRHSMICTDSNAWDVALGKAQGVCLAAPL